MDRVLFTGGTGLIGSNVTPLLKQEFDLLVPHRSELDLLDPAAVKAFIQREKVDVVIHSANPNPVKNKLDEQHPMLEASLRCFMNLYRVRDAVKNLYFIGSGAELDKSRDMHLITEEEFDRSIPGDEYGFAKYIMTSLARQSDNVTNLRIFGCYGPGDWESKFITHCIRSVMDHRDITIRQDCYFDYMQVFDLARIMAHFIRSGAKYHDYNICTGQRVLLSEIARTVLHLMGSDRKIIILKPGLNKEYTASNKRLLAELGEFSFTSLEDGIKIQIESEKRDYHPAQEGT